MHLLADGRAGELNVGEKFESLPPDEEKEGNRLPNQLGDLLCSFLLDSVKIDGTKRALCPCFLFCFKNAFMKVKVNSR